MKKITRIALLEPSVASECVVTELRCQIRTGAPFIAGFLERKGYSARVFAEEIIEFTPQLLKEISENYDSVGISVALNTLIRGLQIAQILKRLKPDMPVSFGGASAAAFADKLLVSSDAVFAGRAEKSFPLWIDSLNGCYEGEIPGIIVKNAVGIFRSDLPSETDDGLTRYDLVDSIGPFSVRNGLFGGPKPAIYSLFASTGCIRKCRFCKSPRNYVKRNLDNVTTDLEMILKIHGNSSPVHVMLVDDCLFGDIEWTKELLRRIAHVSRNHSPRYSAQFHVQPTADNELMSLFRKAGFVSLAIGFESNFQKSLDGESKGTTISQNDYAIEQCRKYGIAPYGYFVAGFDTDTLESVSGIFDYIIDKKLIAQVLPVGIMNRDENGNSTEDAGRVLSDTSFGATVFVSHRPSLMKPSQLQAAINAGYHRIAALSRIPRMLTTYEKMFQFGFNRCFNTWRPNMEAHVEWLKSRSL
ncbi:MAG: hypothetical protein HQM10_22525 [Candidatus Riflebacteria bacterium]|nr:hypothetical protein [Candidatus Riflebacteria bacterium]